MKTSIKLIILGVILALVHPSLGYSRRYNPPPTPPPVYYDYSDALGYEVAYHTTAEWQRLGTNWNSETSPTYNNQDNSDDGVWWAVYNGFDFDTLSWSNNAAILAGQTVVFRFDVTRAAYGDHEYDQLKAWVDWNRDYIFDYEGADSEELIAVQWFKNEDIGILTKSFYATVTIPDSLTGDFWLRARVSCDHTPFDQTTPYGDLWQGEVEDWLFTILENPPVVEQSVVPEPTTLVLFGFGVVGLAFYRKKQNS